MLIKNRMLLSNENGEDLRRAHYDAAFCIVVCNIAAGKGMQLQPAVVQDQCSFDAGKGLAILAANTFP